MQGEMLKGLFRKKKTEALRCKVSSEQVQRIDNFETTVDHIDIDTLLHSFYSIYGSVSEHCLV